VIIFDNGSVDNSLDVIRNVYPSAVVLKSKENIGFAPPHRLASEIAKGEILAFLNNDMRVDSEWLKEGISVLDRSRGVVCSASKLMTWNGKRVEFNGGSLQYLGYADQLTKSDLKTGQEILFPCGGAMFILRDVFREAGCFDDDYFAVFEDVDLGWRLWVMGYKVVMAPESIVYHRGHSTLNSRKESKKRFLMHRNALMTIIKNYDDDNLGKILPLALVLAIKRALLFMNVDKRAFYFWEEQEPKIGIPPKYEEGCIHLAAMDDVFEGFRSLIQKRKTVQGSRKREDEDIFALFKDPFRNIMGYTEYLWDEVSLFGHFGLHRVFDCEIRYKSRLDEGIYHAEKTLETLRGEIPTLSHFQGNMKKLDDRMNLAEKFSRSLKKDGFIETLRKATRYLISS